MSAIIPEISAANCTWVKKTDREVVLQEKRAPHNLTAKELNFFYFFYVFLDYCLALQNRTKRKKYVRE